ncbi:hypothetical protein I8J29_12995 [Paenibacillus sp. MWE-103]|uniref:Tissue inhibitor of metalloproteinase n=1 Tax=Paenibacillus artemisiicola TaxID=1172618 RepID=A0ABS3W9W9_9BACL|nr:hypothetical protein [Paenibacillus artemisiicola]MBO7745119.1 hypothetical protein [Paenibacillus artemisiicola]
MKRTVGVFLTALLAFGTWTAVRPATVHACSCASAPSLEAQLNRDTAVFTGKVVRLTAPAKGIFQSSADPVRVQFEVKTVWKGTLSAQATVYTALSSASCGYDDFQVNEDYLVFAHGKPNRLETGLCNGNKTLAAAQPDLQALGAGYEPVPMKEPLSHRSGAAVIASVGAGVLIAVLLPAMLMRRRRG